MKTVTSTLLLATLTLGEAALAGPKVPNAKILDLYAIKDDDSYVVHIIADDDISEFLSDRKKNDGGTYKLTLDVPALSPINSKYDVVTPFSQRFQVWPMQLQNRIYSRVEIELEMDASSVVGVENASHVFIRIQREGDIVTQSAVEDLSGTNPPESDPADSPPVEVTALGVLPVEPPPDQDSDGEPVAMNVPSSSAGDAPDETPVDEELFFNLFPTPASNQQTLFNVSPVEDVIPDDAVLGIRAGRFALQPSIDASYARGSNLLLATDNPVKDRVLLVRGRVVAILLDSVNELRLSYEGRFRDFETFTLDRRFTNLFDVQARIITTPRTSLAVGNRFVRGAFESQEFDPGGEVIGNTDPFYRNRTDGTFAVDLSERLSGELSGVFNRVEFLEPGSEFFNYDSTDLGGAILYHLSPLTSVVGEFVRTSTRPAPGRSEAESNGSAVLAGLRGEITPLLRGRIRVGYAQQNFDQSLIPLSYNGLIADVRLTREFGLESKLSITAGRRTSPSAYQQNGFYVSNFGSAQFVAPLAEKFRLSATAALFDNRYPLADPATGLDRGDQSVSGAVGVSYFFTPLSFLSVDYRHDRRSSNLDSFSYRNNAVQFMVGFGFLNR